MAGAVLLWVVDTVHIIRQDETIWNMFLLPPNVTTEIGVGGGGVAITSTTSINKRGRGAVRPSCSLSRNINRRSCFYFPQNHRPFDSWLCHYEPENTPQLLVVVGQRSVDGFQTRAQQSTFSYEKRRRRRTEKHFCLKLLKCEAAKAVPRGDARTAFRRQMGWKYLEARFYHPEL